MRYLIKTSKIKVPVTLLGLFILILGNFPIYTAKSYAKVFSAGNSKNQLIIVLKNEGLLNGLENLGYQQEEIATICRQTSSLLIDTALDNHQIYYLIETPDIPNALETILSDARVKYAEPNYLYKTCVVFDDPLYKDQKRDLEKIQAPWGWDVEYTTNVPVVVIDTGIDVNHEDLNILPASKNILTDDYDLAEVESIHGSHVAGIGAKSNNGVGVSGVGSGIPILALKVATPEGFISVFGAIKGIQYAMSNYSQAVFNFSWGGYEKSRALSDAIDAATNNGALFVAAAGNEENNNDLQPFYPANDQNVLSVAAYDTELQELAYFSNYGDSVDIVAPGVGILTTSPGNQYRKVNGTSFASPHVAMAAALIMGRGISAHETNQILKSSATRLEELYGKTESGLLNLRDSMTLTRNVTEADAGSSITIQENQKTNLVGSVNDPEGDQKKYIWKFDGKTEYGRRITYKSGKIGWHDIKLIVNNDSEESVSTTSVRVTDKVSINRTKMKWSKGKFTITASSSRINQNHPLSTMTLIVMDGSNRKILGISPFASSINGATYKFSGKIDINKLPPMVKFKVVSFYLGISCDMVKKP